MVNDESVMPVCVNDAGFKCLRRFEYNGVTYDRCTIDGSKGPDWSPPVGSNLPLPWCYDIRGNKEWDYCTTCRGTKTLIYFKSFKWN